MGLTAGARLGVYEIVAPLGAGGKGEVYRARDTKLKRDVALKVLPDSFTNDPDRLARFQREAEVLAALNHPHIAHLHGLEESNGVRALVLEFVDGPTLADRIAEGLLEGEDPRYATSGHLLFLRGTEVWATRFDADRGQVVSDAFRVLDNVRIGLAGLAMMSLSNTGTLAVAG